MLSYTPPLRRLSAFLLCACVVCAACVCAVSACARKSNGDDAADAGAAHRESTVADAGSADEDVAGAPEIDESAAGGYDVIDVVSKSNMPWLGYSVDLELNADADASLLNNPNDVVTPYVEDRFRVRVTDVTQKNGSRVSFKDRLELAIAAGAAPDVVVAGADNCAFAVSTGEYGDLTPQIDRMANLSKTFDPAFWPRFMTGGKKTQIPITGPDVSKEPYASDPYIAPMSSWGLWVREDVLAKCGYSFASLKEIERQYLSGGRVAPAEAYATDPPIDTPNDFYELLKKIRGLNMTVNGEPLIPWSSAGWSQFHLGCMFDFGHWRYDPSTGEADGFLGSPDAKEYYRYLNRLYYEGLVDADFLRHSADQLQGKIAAGRVAAGIYIPDVREAQDGLFESVGEAAVVRYIKWPKKTEGAGAFDIFENGFWRVIIRDGYPDKDRLTQYFDWFYSDEGQEILTWGPENAGLWEEDENGDKRFYESRVEEDCLNGVAGARGADYWGLYSTASGAVFPFLSRAGICAPHTTVNYADYRRLFPPKLDGMVMNRAAVSLGGYDRSSRYAYGDGSETVSKASDYYWSVFVGESAQALLSAADDEEFDAAWDAAYVKFLRDAEYAAARRLMTEWFRANYAP